MREDDIGQGAAGLRCAVAMGYITGAVRQRAYAMGDLQMRHVSVCHVAQHIDFQPTNLHFSWDSNTFGSS